MRLSVVGSRLADMFIVTNPAGHRIAYGTEEQATRAAAGREGWTVLASDHPEVAPYRAGLPTKET